jgi:hypothetical protein
MTASISGDYPTVCLDFSLSLSLFPLALSWGTGHPWNASFRFSFLILRQSVRLLGREISPLQGRYLYTGQHKHRIDADRHSCLEWDSNPRSQCSSERRQFMPQAARPPVIGTKTLWQNSYSLLTYADFQPYKSCIVNVLSGR